MYGGWMSFGGNEVVNVSRTERYAQSLGLGWFKACDDCDNLGKAVEATDDPPYQSVLVDQPGWFDPDDPDTWAFAGLYPLDIQGADDSVRTASVVEGLSDGGVIGPVRQATRPIVFSGLLLGADDCAVAAGMSWLRWVLLGSNCREDPFCVGDEVCFLSCCPDLCDNDPNFPGHCLDDYIRHFHRAVVTEGPTVTAKHQMSTGGSAWEIQFTITCGVPWSYGNPYVIYDDTKFPTTSHVVTDDPLCLQPVEIDYRDPWCPKIPRSPTVPSIALDCFSLPDTWDRYAFPIPAEAVRTWQDAVPYVEFQTGQGEGVRGLRVRYYSDPLGWGHMARDPDCGYCGEFVITYIPPQAHFIIDGVKENIQVRIGNDRFRNAANSVYASDGGPFEWPLITCGHNYMMTIDVPHGALDAQRVIKLSTNLTPRGI